MYRTRSISLCSSLATVWNTIKPKLLNALQVECTRRADEALLIKWYMRVTELQPLYEKFVWDQAIEESRPEDVWARTMPAFLTALGLPSMRALLTCAMPSEHVSQEDFAAITPALMQDVQEAMIKARHYGANMLRETAEVSAQVSTGKAGTSTQKGSSVGKDKGKDERNTCDCTQESLETAKIGIGALFADPAEADRAILERSTSLFMCNHPICLQRQQIPNPMRKNYVMTFLGLLQHDAMAHPSSSWDRILARPAAETMGALMPSLFDALGMPRSTTLSALHERLNKERPGRCSCGAVFNMPHIIAPTPNPSDRDLIYLVGHPLCLSPTCDLSWSPRSIFLTELLNMQLEHINGPTSYAPAMYICVSALFLLLFRLYEYLKFGQPGPNGVHNHNSVHNITLHPRPNLNTIQPLNRDTIPLFICNQGGQYRPLALIALQHRWATELISTDTGFQASSSAADLLADPNVQGKMRVWGELFNEPERLFQ